MAVHHIPTNSLSLSEWYKLNSDQNVEYKFHEPEPSTVTFHCGTDEMLRVTPDGFYVRGVKVEQGPEEAEVVYKSFKEFLAWAHLTRK